MTRSLYHRERDPFPIVQESGYDPGPVWTGRKTPPPLGFDARIVQPVASRYNEKANTAHFCTFVTGVAGKRNKKKDIFTDM
jgi:hypothetical protein